MSHCIRQKWIDLLNRKSTQLTPFILQDKAVTPRLVQAHQVDGGMQIEWEKPIDTERMIYNKGEGVAHIGALMYTPHSGIGTIF